METSIESSALLQEGQAQPVAPTAEQDEAQLRSKDSLYDDPVEDIAFALAFELEGADLSHNDLVTVNREKLRGIARRVLAKAAIAASSAHPVEAQPVAMTDDQIEGLFYDLVSPGLPDRDMDIAKEWFVLGVKEGIASSAAKQAAPTDDQVKEFACRTFNVNWYDVTPMMLTSARAALSAQAAAPSAPKARMLSELEFDEVNRRCRHPGDWMARAIHKFCEVNGIPLEGGEGSGNAGVGKCDEAGIEPAPPTVASRCPTSAHPSHAELSPIGGVDTADEREAFEAYSRRRPDGGFTLERMTDGRYTHYNTRWAWETWQAARGVAGNPEASADTRNEGGQHG